RQLMHGPTLAQNNQTENLNGRMLEHKNTAWASPCEHQIARLLGYRNCGGIGHRLRDSREHRGVDDPQVRDAFYTQGIVDDGPHAAGADRVMEGICRTKNEFAYVGRGCSLGPRISFLRAPVGKGSTGPDFAGERNALDEKVKIGRLGEVVR